MATVVMLALVTLLLGGALLHSYISANRLARCSWEELLAQLHRIETDGVTAVAMNHLAPGKKSAHPSAGGYVESSGRSGRVAAHA